MKISFDQKHIEEAEKLLIYGEAFDEERLKFIECLETCDLLAVPGSGKTTALLAKLYCLSKQFPFENGGGILVLAHTNSSVNEIKKKLQSHCPALFEYPNFVGTIQSFVNKFLAIPYFTNTNHQKIDQVSIEMYRKEITQRLSKRLSLEVAYFNRKNPKIFYDARFKLKGDGEYSLVDGLKNKELELTIPQKWITENTSEVRKERIFKFIRDCKIEIMQNGILHFDDCYFLSDKSLFKYPFLSKIFQKRFNFVFIDEMQDLEQHQIEIIDKIFFQESSPTIIQRIGDKNQAIFQPGKKDKTQCEWKTRKEINSKFEDRYLKGSNRLTQSIANLVNYFTLNDENENFVVEGKKVLPNGDIPPTLVVFNHATKGELFKKFESIIHQHANNSKIPITTENSFKIIGWNGEWNVDEDDESKTGEKLRLKDIFPNYSKQSNSSKESFKTLSEYLQLFNQSDKTLKASQKAILNALSQILYLQGEKYPSFYRQKQIHRYFSNDSMVQAIKDFKKENNFLKAYELFQGKMYKWSFDLSVRNKALETYNSIVTFINAEFRLWFDFELNQESKDFIGSFIEHIPSQATEDQNNNPLGIEIASVHSVKGQTHCATMYVETAYSRPVYEILKIKSSIKPKNPNTNPFFKERHKCNATRDREALKMMYVGFSRPTHLLCFAALEENVKDDLEKFRNAGWMVNDELVTRRD